jgi:hypothetical protein
MNVLYLENMLVVFLRTFGRQRPQQTDSQPCGYWLRLRGGLLACNKICNNILLYSYISLD